MKYLKRSALILAQASNGNPVITTVTVIVFMFAFNMLEAVIEKLIFGERFEHWLDPFFITAFISYAAYSVWMCAVYNTTKALDTDAQTSVMLNITDIGGHFENHSNNCMER